MTAKPSQWHLKRQKEILRKHPSIAKLPKHNFLSLIPIIFTPLIYVCLTYMASKLSVVGGIILAYTAGAQCNFSIFKYSHEISHKLISPKISSRGHLFLLRYLTLLSLTPSIYLLFNFGHKPHHSKLGESSIADAKKVLSSKLPDMELLIDRYFYQIKKTQTSGHTSHIPYIFNNRFFRILSIGILFPVISTINGTFVFHFFSILNFIQSIFIKKDDLFHNRMNMVAFSMMLLYSAIITLYLLLGYKAILFLLMSDMFLRGLLWHPAMLFPLATHKSWQSKHSSQPTTSIYGKLISMWLMNMNHHVEHHDFPYIPCRYLPTIRKTAPEYYDTLNSFSGYRDILIQYFHTKNWMYARL